MCRMGGIVGILMLAIASILLLAGIDGLDNKAEASKGGDIDPDPFSGCERIFEYFPYCIEFLVGDPNFSKPSRRCCQHIEKLNTLAKHRTGPRTICWCIQVMAKGMTPPLIPSKIDDLPILCHTHLSFPISDSMDCSKVH